MTVKPRACLLQGAPRQACGENAALHCAMCFGGAHGKLCALFIEPACGMALLWNMGKAGASDTCCLLRDGFSKK